MALSRSKRVEGKGKRSRVWSKEVGEVPGVLINREQEGIKGQYFEVGGGGEGGVKWEREGILMRQEI